MLERYPHPSLHGKRTTSLVAFAIATARSIDASDERVTSDSVTFVDTLLFTSLLEMPVQVCA